MGSGCRDGHLFVFFFYPPPGGRIVAARRARVTGQAGRCRPPRSTTPTWAPSHSTYPGDPTTTSNVHGGAPRGGAALVVPTPGPVDRRIARGVGVGNPPRARHGVLHASPRWGDVPDDLVALTMRRAPRDGGGDASTTDLGPLPRRRGAGGRKERGRRMVGDTGRASEGRWRVGGVCVGREAPPTGHGADFAITERCDYVELALNPHPSTPSWTHWPARLVTGVATRRRGASGGPLPMPSRAGRPSSFLRPRRLQDRKTRYGHPPPSTCWWRWPVASARAASRRLLAPMGGDEFTVLLRGPRRVGTGGVGPNPRNRWNEPIPVAARGPDGCPSGVALRRGHPPRSPQARRHRGVHRERAGGHRLHIASPDDGGGRESVRTIAGRAGTLGPGGPRWWCGTRAAMTSSAASAGTSTIEKRSAIRMAPMSLPPRRVSLAMAPTRSAGRTPELRPMPT